MYGSKSKKKEGDDGQIYQYLIFIGILARNIGVFLSQTVQTLKTAKQEDISEQYDDKRMNTKLRVIDFDVVMTHALPFT